MKKKFTFVVLKVTREGRSKQAFNNTHNNLPLLSSAIKTFPGLLLNTVFYCAVVWVEQLADIQNRDQKQSGKHSNVSNAVLALKRKHLTSDLHGESSPDTNCQLLLRKLRRDVGVNGCLVTTLNGFVLKLVNSIHGLMKGYRGYYA